MGQWGPWTEWLHKWVNREHLCSTIPSIHCSHYLLFLHFAVVVRAICRKQQCGLMEQCQCQLPMCCRRGARNGWADVKPMLCTNPYTFPIITLINEIHKRETCVFVFNACTGSSKFSSTPSPSSWKQRRCTCANIIFCFFEIILHFNTVIFYGILYN